MYLISIIWFCLLLAFAFGFGLAWFFLRDNARRQEEELTARWERRLGDMQRERDTSMAKLRRELEDQRQQVPTLETSLAERSDLIAKLEADLAQWREQQPDTDARLAERERQLAAAGDELATQKPTIEKLTRELEEARREAESNHADAQQARKERHQFGVKADELARKAQETEQAARAIAQELDAEIVLQKTALRQAQSDRDEALVQVRSMRAAADKRASQPAADDGGLAQANRERDAALEQNRTLRASLDELRAQPRDMFDVSSRGQAPEGLLAALPEGQVADDLKKIRGVGPVLEGTLNRLGIYFFRQVAQLGEEEIQWVADHINTFPGRIERDQWIAQAAKLGRIEPRD